MSNIERPKNVLALTQEMLELYNDVIFDRDGTLGHYGKPIGQEVALHVNGLIRDNPEKRFSIVTNGDSETAPIDADVIRTPLPFIKQFRPNLFLDHVEDRKKSLLITDSFSETTLGILLGFHVFYLEEKLTPHPYEQFLRSTTGPMRAPIGRLIGV